MFCNSKETNYNVSRNFKNGPLCIYAFNYKLRNNFLGESTMQWGFQNNNNNNNNNNKKVIRIITNSRMRDSCRALFKKLKILPLYSQYIFSLSISVIKNEHLFYTNDEIHSIHTRFKTNLHPPIANLTKFQNGVYYSGIWNFNNLPHNVKDLTNEIILSQNALKRFLLINSFYNSEEYFNYQR